MHALVIDDARFIRMHLRGALQQFGFEVSEATNGHEGLMRLRHGNRPDIVLTDCHMPGMDGIEFVRRVRREPAFAGIPVIFITGEDEDGMSEQALAEGANACMSKSFTQESLREQLTRLGLAVNG